MKTVFSILGRRTGLQILT